MNEQKFGARKWLWYVLAGVIVIATAYVAWNRYGTKGTNETLTSPTPTSSIAKKSPTASPSLTTNTADWQTYTNDIYGFSFKYPEGATITPLGMSTDPTKASGVVVILPKLANNKANREVFIVDVKDPRTDQGNMNDAVDLDLKRFVDKIWQWNKEDKNPSITEKEVGDISDTKIDSMVAYTFDLSESYTDKNGGYILYSGEGDIYGTHTYVFVENSSNKYIIHFPIDYSESAVILSTFKFTQ